MVGLRNLCMYVCMYVCIYIYTYIYIGFGGLHHLERVIEFNNSSSPPPMTPPRPSLSKAPGGLGGVVQPGLQAVGEGAGGGGAGVIVVLEGKFSAVAADEVLADALWHVCVCVCVCVCVHIILSLSLSLSLSHTHIVFLYIICTHTYM